LHVGKGVELYFADFLRVHIETSVHSILSDFFNMCQIMPDRRSCCLPKILKYLHRIKYYGDILAFWYNYHMQLMISINETPNFAILHEV